MNKIKLQNKRNYLLIQKHNICFDYEENVQLLVAYKKPNKVMQKMYAKTLKEFSINWHTHLSYLKNNRIDLKIDRWIPNIILLSLTAFKVYLEISQSRPISNKLDVPTIIKYRIVY